MLCAALALPGQELVTLGTTETIARATIPWPKFGFVQQDIVTIRTRVETLLNLVGFTMGAKTCKNTLVYILVQ